MKREDKQRVVEELHGAWSDVNTGVVTHYRGLSVSAMGNLRRSLRQADVSLQVVKNSLARRAAEGTDFSVMEEFFSGPTAVAYGNDPVGLAKALSQFAKENEALQIVGGVLDGKRLEKGDISALASVPPREVLLAQLLSGLNAPISGFVRTLGEVPASFVRTLAAVRDQKQASA
ncbi:MAG TPA: 50S ribosomal protein L10 [Mariprofundaceae bacterium]|nr:50S ribosomal protein L10 [Mariprofundaceae bacterium]